MTAAIKPVPEPAGMALLALAVCCARPRPPRRGA